MLKILFIGLAGGFLIGCLTGIVIMSLLQVNKR